MSKSLLEFFCCWTRILRIIGLSLLGLYATHFAVEAGCPHFGAVKWIPYDPNLLITSPFVLAPKAISGTVPCSAAFGPTNQPNRRVIGIQLTQWGICSMRTANPTSADFTQSDPTKVRELTVLPNSSIYEYVWIPTSVIGPRALEYVAEPDCAISADEDGLYPYNGNDMSTRSFMGVVGYVGFLTRRVGSFEPNTGLSIYNDTKVYTENVRVLVIRPKVQAGGFSRMFNCQKNMIPPNATSLVRSGTQPLFERGCEQGCELLDGCLTVEKVPSIVNGSFAGFLCNYYTGVQVFPGPATLNNTVCVALPAW